MSTEAVVYEDVEARVRANQEAAAEAKAQTEVFTGVATERGIQCQKALEIITLWFYDWEPEHLKHWNALSGDQRPTVDAAVALVAACLAYAPDHEVKEEPAAAAATEAEREAAEHADEPTRRAYEEPRPNQGTQDPK